MLVKPPCEICKAVLAQHTGDDGKPLHGDELLQSKLAEIMTPDEVIAHQLVSGPADPRSGLHDPQVAKAQPAGVQAALSHMGSPQAAPPAPPVQPTAQPSAGSPAQVTQ